MLEVTRNTYSGVALRKESVDRNLDICNSTATLPRSLSARRAWIEIPIRRCNWLTAPVALRKESVDRNFYTVQIIIVIMVALRKESVDRNFYTVQIIIVIMVALRKESVDRNIELWKLRNPSRVALRKESVDRNNPLETLIILPKRRSPQGERG